MNLRRPADLTAADFPIPHRPAAAYSAIQPLLELCRSGKLYEIEAWITAGRPIQFPVPTDHAGLRRDTALKIAVNRRFHSLAALLLANGYDPNADACNCLFLAVRAKEHALVELLLHFGADPRTIAFSTVFETRDRTLMDWFVERGADPCLDDAVAGALGSICPPLLSFIKQYRNRFQGMQRQFDIALRSYTEAENLAGVKLTLKLGATPHGAVPNFRKSRMAAHYETAFDCALLRQSSAILELFLARPIPPQKVQEHFFALAYCRRPDLVRRFLAEGADPNMTGEDGCSALHIYISALTWRRLEPTPDERARGLEALEVMLQAGARWSLADVDVKHLRQDLADGESRVVRPMLELLRRYEVFTSDEFRELTESPAVKKVLKGISKPRRHPRAVGPALHAPLASAAPAPGGYWKRHWSQR